MSDTAKEKVLGISDMKTVLTNGKIASVSDLVTQNAAEPLPAQPELKRKPITPCVGDPAGTGFCEFHDCENDCQSVESLPVEAKEPDWGKMDYSAKAHGCPCKNCEEPKPTPSTPTEPIEDSARIEAKIRSKIVMDGATPEDWIWETLAVLEAENRLFDIQPASISRAAEPKPTPSTPAAKLLFCPWEQCRTTGECQFPEECSANDFYIAHLENQLKPHPASISSEAMPEQLVDEEFLNLRCEWGDHPCGSNKIARELQQWRKWAAAKGSTETEGR